MPDYHTHPVERSQRQVRRTRGNSPGSGLRSTGAGIDSTPRTRLPIFGACHPAAPAKTLPRSSPPGCAPGACRSCVGALSTSGMLMHRTSGPAEAAAAVQFGLDEEQRKRLAVRKVE